MRGTVKFLEEMVLSAAGRGQPQVQDEGTPPTRTRDEPPYEPLTSHARADTRHTSEVVHGNSVHSNITSDARWLETHGAPPSSAQSTLSEPSNGHKSRLLLTHTAHRAWTRPSTLYMATEDTSVA